MMKRLSVKGRMTVWYTALMAVMAVMMLVFLLAISSSVATGTAMDQLSQTLRGNLTQVTREDGLLQFGDGFAFSPSSRPERRLLSCNSRYSSRFAAPSA